MVIRDFYVKRVTVFKAKTGAPLVVDPDAPLSTAGPVQWLQSIRLRHPQIAEHTRSVEMNHPIRCSDLDARRKTAGLSCEK